MLVLCAFTVQTQQQDTPCGQANTGLANKGAGWAKGEPFLLGLAALCVLWDGAA